MFLAKSILCDHPKPLACEECLTCRRVENDEYPDLVLIDGEEETIKKGDVESVVSLFQKTPLENKGIMVYLIHEAENMTPEASNALLKFLAEPTPHAYAILTTRNRERLLPTIVSRCESLPLFLLPREEGYHEALELGVEQEDAELLSFFVNDGPSIAKKAKDSGYLHAKAAWIETMDALSQNPARLRYIIQKSVVKALTDKPTTRLYFDFLALSYKDIVTRRRGGKPILPVYATILDAAIDKAPHPESSLLSIMTLRREADTPINTTLLLTHLSRVLTKE